MQRLTVRKKETAEVAGAEMSFALSQRARHAARVLLQRFPDTGSDPGARREASRPSGRLNDGIAQVPPPRGRSELEAFRQTLPVAAFREQLLGTIAKSNILLVLGETGSGKTTQIPQYILDEGSRLGSPCRVICAQPRRISAVAAAERVAEERGEGVGQTVGYQIRLESKVSPKTLLTFCTNDVLLRTLMAGDSATSTVVTHIIVDEIHERDRFCDILLIKLRDILERQCNLRVVLMSAPLNVSLFSEYFGGCPVVRLPGRLFEVKRFFLEDILPTTGYKSKEMERRQKEKDQLESQQNNLSERYEEETGPSVPVRGASVALLTDQTKILNIEGGESAFEQEAERDGSKLEPWLVKEMDACITNMWLHRDEDASTQLLHLLISERVSVDYRHSEKTATPLMVAAGRGLIDIVELLLRMGADVNLKDSNGMNTFDWAKKFHESDVVELLESSAASVGEPGPDQSKLANASTGLSPECRELLGVYHHTLDDDDDKVDLDLILHLLNQICQSSSDGAVLIFLPGYDEIITLRDLILWDDKRFAGQSHKYHVFTLHSNMQTCDQRRVLRSVPPGTRKIAANLLLRLRQKWRALFARRMREPSRAPSQADEATVSAVVAALAREDEALGLRRPAGIGRRPTMPIAPAARFSPPAAAAAAASLRLSASERRFVAKSGNVRSLELSQQRAVWPTKLNGAFSRSCAVVHLVFSVRGSGRFQGYARTVSEIGKERSETGGSPALGGAVSGAAAVPGAESPSGRCSTLLNPWCNNNNNKRVQVSRDGQELETRVGEQLLKLWDRWPCVAGDGGGGGGDGGGVVGASGTAGGADDDTAELIGSRATRTPAADGTPPLLEGCAKAAASHSPLQMPSVEGEEEAEAG
uniref:RNA helicase n=1 Tax=Petromyzon marinus TaxID=7757 RepID=A0AAJ7UMD5_PETMA|nr:LOW QUALITY PROTEIN: 3'-5' RNA helicase YTHDC2-like [Petromyzon marinus]